MRSRVVNNGTIEHEFRLTSYSELEERPAGDGSPGAKTDHPDDGSVATILVEPGTSRVVDVTFPDNVTTYETAACLIQGHYEAGMWANINYRDTSRS